MEVNHDWIPPCSRESHPRSAMPTFSSPPPPPPPCTNLNFHCVFPIFFSLQFLPIPTVLLLLLLSPPPPPPPPVKVCAYCVYCHDEVVCQCSMLSGDPAGPPHGTWRTTAIHGWLTRLELYLCTDLLSCHSVFTTHFFPTLHYSMHPAIIFLTSQCGVCVL